MNLVPLYAAAEAPGAWHQVTAAGGYEWWHLDAENSADGTRVVAAFFDGFTFHPDYRKRYARYRRRPTVHAPPVASEYRCVRFDVYRDGGVWGRFLARFGRGDFAASAERVDIRLGPNRLTAEEGGIRLTISDSASSLGGEFLFRPTFAHRAVEVTPISRELAGAEHRWVVANPLCDVRGSISRGGERIEFAGRGYHDHQFGTGPVGLGVRRWVRGRVLLGGRSFAFTLARPGDRQLGVEGHLVEANAAGERELPVVPEVTWSGLWRYPSELRFGAHLRLTSPRVIDASRYGVRLTYEADAAGERGTALCDTVKGF